MRHFITAHVHAVGLGFESLVAHLQLAWQAVLRDSPVEVISRFCPWFWLRKPTVFLPRSSPTFPFTMSWGSTAESCLQKNGSGEYLPNRFSAELHFLASTPRYTLIPRR